VNETSDSRNFEVQINQIKSGEKEEGTPLMSVNYWKAITRKDSLNENKKQIMVTDVQNSGKGEMRGCGALSKIIFQFVTV
jgi:hypothetical protein